MSKSRSEKYERISEESLKKFLEDNNVSLDQLEGEGEQEKFISDLSEALNNLRKSNRETREECLREIVPIVSKIYWPENVINSLGKTFIPPMLLDSNDKEEVDELKNNTSIVIARTTEIVDEAKRIDEEIKKKEERMEQLKKEQAKLDKEIEELKTKQDKFKNKDSEIIIEPKDVVEKIEPEIIDNDEFIDLEERIVEDIDEPTYIDLEETEHNETIREMVKDVWNEHKTLHNQVKELKDKKGKTIYEGVRDICESSADLLRFSKFLNGDIGHDLLISGSIVLGTTVAVTTYTAARVTLKLAKEAVKLGAKGVVKLAGLGLKAAKGTAKIAKKKADKIRENREIKNKEKYENALETIQNADDLTNEILEFSEDRLNYSKVDIDTLDDKHAEILKDIRDDELRTETEEELNKDNSKILMDAKKKLRMLRLKKVYNEFGEKFGLNNREILDFINDISLDENEELVLGQDSPVTLEEIEKAGLDKHLKVVLGMPRISDLSNEDVIAIADTIEVKGEKIDFTFDDSNKADDLGISEEALEFAKTVKGSQFYYDGAEEDIRNLHIDCDNFEMNQDILREAYDRDLRNSAQELRDQIIEMEEEFCDIEYLKQEEGKKEMKLTRRQDELKKIAMKKIESLKEVGIAEIVQDEKGKTTKILDEAKKALSQDLTQDLEYTADKKYDRIYRDNEQDYEEPIKE